MRVAGGILSALLALLLLSAALLFGANWYLRDGGGQIGEILRRYAPDAEARFSRAGLRLGFNGASFYAEDLFLQRGENAKLYAPRAEFWVGANGISALLHSPEITVQTGGGAIPIAGKWAVEARQAKVLLQDSDGASLTLQNAFLQARGEDGYLQVSVYESDESQNSELRAAAELQIDASGDVRGTAELAAKHWNFGEELNLPWQTMQTTVRAQIAKDGVRIFAAGHVNLTATMQWRADGLWRDGKANLTIKAAVDNWIPIADAASLNAFAKGVLQSDGGKWQWQGDVVAAGADGAASGTIRASGDKTKIAESESHLRIANAPANILWKYVSPDDAREWLKESVPEGIISIAKLRARGTPSNIRAELTAAFSGGRIRIGEEWPDAENLSGVLALKEDGGIAIDGEGEVAGAFADIVRARIPATDSETPATLHLQAAFASAPLNLYLSAASALPPARAKVEEVLRQLQFAGNGKLLLTMQVPLSAPEDSAFDARLTILGDGEIVAADLPPLHEIAGDAIINADGIRASLNGTLAGESAIANVQNEEIELRGTIPAKTALSLANVFNFPADGAAKFLLNRTLRETIFISDLRGVSLSLPHPLAKNAKEPAFLKAETANGNARASLRLGENSFIVQTKNSGGADIAINELSQPPPKNGMQIHGKIRGAPDVAGWLLQSGNGGGDVALSIALSEAEMWNMPRQNLTAILHLPNGNGERKIELQGDSVAGEILYKEGVARASLSHLHLAGIAGGGDSPDIRGLSLSVRADDLRIGGVALGALSLRGAPDGGGWRMESLRIANGENDLTAGGLYDGARTSLSVQLSAPNAAAALSVFGQANVVSEGGATLSGVVFWRGAPPDFSLDSAGGSANLLAENLRYLKSEQNVIGLLAVLSPQSLLQLGFTELGKEGVRIDSMRGEIALQNGAAEFRDIVMENDDLNISLRGETDLRARTLNISGRVRPGNRLLKAGSAAGIGAVASVQPIALAAGWFLGKVFEKPLSEIGAYNYAVTGDWSNPIYAEISSSAATDKVAQ